MDQSHNGQQQRGGPLPPLPPQVWQNQIEPVFQHQPGFMQMPPFVVANVRICFCFLIVFFLLLLLICFYVFEF